MEDQAEVFKANDKRVMLTMYYYIPEESNEDDIQKIADGCRDVIKQGGGTGLNYGTVFVVDRQI